MRKRFSMVLLTVAMILMVCSCSQSKKEIKIGFDFNSLDKDSTPYTEVYFKVFDEKEEKVLIGSFAGSATMIESFENRSFFNKNSIMGCQVFYAGGGNNIFAYLEGNKLIVKHIEFVLGNEDEESSVLKEEVVTTKEISDTTVISKYE